MRTSTRSYCHLSSSRIITELEIITEQCLRNIEKFLSCVDVMDTHIQLDNIFHKSSDSYLDISGKSRYVYIYMFIKWNIVFIFYLPYVNENNKEIYKQPT